MSTPPPSGVYYLHIDIEAHRENQLGYHHHRGDPGAGKTVAKVFKRDKYFLYPTRDKHSNESSNWFVKRGLSRPFLKTFASVYPDPTDHPWVSEDGHHP